MRTWDPRVSITAAWRRCLHRWHGLHTRHGSMACICGMEARLSHAAWRRGLHTQRGGKACTTRTNSKST
eukprot:18811-Chlamydomonas_euryale.AAC.1